MADDQVVLITETLSDYAVAAAAHARLGPLLGAASVCPVWTTPAERLLLEPVAAHHGVRLVDAAAQWSGDRIARSIELAGACFPGTEPVRVRPDAGPSPLAAALAMALAQGRPLVLDAGAGDLRAEPGAASAPAPLAGPVLLVREGSEAAVPGVLYAHITGKALRFVEQVGQPDHLAEPFAGGQVTSLLLVDDYPTFRKAALGRISAWSQSSAGPSGGTGILTAYSTSQLTGLVWRLAVGRRRRARGAAFAMPNELARVVLHGMTPLEYYVVSEHGNERHIQHGEEVLCGAFPPELRRGDTGGFDCEPQCPYNKRIRGSDIRAENIIVLSCDTATVGDGIAPPEFNVLLNLLQGFCTSVLAPCKHAQVNEGNARLADALVRAGYTLGEIATRLNSVTAFRTSPDAPFVLVGDPDVVVRPCARRDAEPRLEPVERGVEIACNPIAGPLLDCTLPLAALGDPPRAPVLVPLSDELLPSDIYLAWRTLPDPTRIGLLVFGPREFSGAPLRVRLEPAVAIDEADRRRALELEGGLRRLHLFGIKPAEL